MGERIIFAHHKTDTMTHRLFSLLFACIVTASLTSQTRTQLPMHHSDQLTSYDGLGHESVFKIYKDCEGLLWLGTNKGVRSYNGHSVVKYPCDEEMGFVYTLGETEDGRLLAGGSTGLYEVNREKGCVFRIAPDIGHVSSICQHWVGGNDGLWLEKKGHYERIPIESSVISKGNAVTDIVPDRQGGVWVSTTKRLVHISMPEGTMSRYSIPDSLLTHNIRRICLMGQHIYIGTRNDGLLTFNTLTHQTARTIGVPSRVITDVNTDGSRFLYVATDGNGAYTIDVSTGSIVEAYHGRSDAIYTFWRDPQLGVNFFGYYLDGFSHDLLVRPLVSTYRCGVFDSSSLPVRCCCRQGDFMVVGTRKGLYLYDERQGILHTFSPDQLEASIITNITFFAGRFVIATYENGLRTLSTDGVLSTLMAGGSFSRLCPVPLLQGDEGNRLFALSNMGVTVFDEHLNVVKQFNSKNSELPDELLIDIAFDTTGKAWISSLSRLCVYDPLLHTIQSQGFPKGFFNDVPSLKFAPAADGDMLAWSGHRLYKAKLDFSSYEEIALPSRLHIDDISFVRWHRGRYWMGTGQGLFVVDEDFASHVLHLSEADGLPSLRFQRQECFVAPDGSLWMGTDQGVVTINSAQQLHLGDSMTSRVVFNSLTWEGSRLATFQPLLLNYGSDLGKMYEWQLDGGDSHVCSDGDIVTLGWQRWGKHCLSVWLMGHPETCVKMTYLYLPTPLFWAICTILLLVILTVWLARRHAVDSYRCEEDEKKRRAEEARLAKLYERERLSPDECAAIYQKMCAHIEATQCYTNPSLRIGDIAAAIDVHQARLSQMFSTYLHSSFADHINRLRIAEFKRRAMDAQYAQFSTVALAEMCGLRKSAFFAAFKRYEGCTPNEWRLRLNDALR